MAVIPAGRRNKMENIKDFFDKVINNNQESESNNNDNQGPELVIDDDDDPQPDWNQYLEEDRCPYCGEPNHICWKVGKPDGKKLGFYRCINCPGQWVVLYSADGEIEKCIAQQAFFFEYFSKCKC
jgi:hypothetical protein